MTKLNCIAKLNWVVKASAVFLLWAGAAVVVSAQATGTAPSAPNFQTLYNFPSPSGGWAPTDLVQGLDGELYGTTTLGGIITDESVNGSGIVFKITTTGVLTTLYSFCPQNGCTDGKEPLAGLIQAKDGSFYGTTLYGGSEGSGTAFKITASGTLTTLYRFCSGGLPPCPDGEMPYVSLVQAADANFYGTTYSGGNSGSCQYGSCGTVFKMTPSGILTTLYRFCSQSGCTDGDNPRGILAQGLEGNFYGTTEGGGANGGGTIFKITPSGTLTTVYSFCSQNGCADGSVPYSGLALGADGHFYGTTFSGGEDGTAFKITPGGKLTTLDTFNGTDASGPAAGLILGTDGNFYGTTVYGGANDNGTIFQLTPSGTLTMLHSFNGRDGETPYLGLVQGTDGSFYGATGEGGTNDCQGYSCGTIFRLSVGLGLFVRTNPVAGKVGATVGILGTGLTGATGVKFNGTETAFRVVSSSFIEAKVPSGATTGTVQVQLPSGTLSSNVPFIVLP